MQSFRRRSPVDQRVSGGVALELADPRVSGGVALELADTGADLERRAELDAHGLHEVLLAQQRQRLTVDLLTTELIHVNGDRINATVHVSKLEPAPVGIADTIHLVGEIDAVNEKGKAIITMLRLNLVRLLFYLYFANNVANPVIYSFMNTNFREDLVRIFSKRH